MLFVVRNYGQHYFYIVLTMATSIELYTDFYADCAHPDLYAAPWWLDAVCGEGRWEAIQLVTKRDQTTAFIPFYKTHIRRLSALITPALTQWIPIVAKEDSHDFSIDDFLETLPPCSILDLTMKPGKNPILSSPAYHVNFKYSYVIPYRGLNDQLKLNYNEGLRRNLREAEKNYSIVASDDIQTFVHLCKSSYRNRKLKPPFWLDQIVPAAVGALKKNGSGVINLAFHHGAVIAGILTGWDTRTTYYLTGGRNGDEQGASAHALLLDHVINQAHGRGHSFDFEGSMHPGIANFFQSFGATPEPYLQIRKFSGMGRIWSFFH
ncbi:MAG: GNAT family N-acetyltransferase [Saprospiraceae bacterium]